MRPSSAQIIAVADYITSNPELVSKQKSWTDLARMLNAAFEDLELKGAQVKRMLIETPRFTPLLDRLDGRAPAVHASRVELLEKQQDDILSRLEAVENKIASMLIDWLDWHQAIDKDLNDLTANVDKLYVDGRTYYSELNKLNPKADPVSTGP